MELPVFRIALPLRAPSSFPRRLLRSLLPNSSHPNRKSSSLSHIHGELTSRKLPIIYDTPSQVQTNLLHSALADYLPVPTYETEEGFPRTTWLPPGYHLIYFPVASRESELLPDGTDPLQSPGKPFVRRMWAGGRMHFRPFSPLKLDGRPAVCTEQISDVAIKGPPGDEKIFVTIERRMGPLEGGKSQLRDVREKARTSPDKQRDMLNRDEYCAVIEHRNIVFMREKHASRSVPKEVQPSSSASPEKILKPTTKPDYRHPMTPSASLLYRFSGLTYNVHKIHLDRDYCRAIEGHRNLIVHGPLSLVIMLQTLRRHLQQSASEHRSRAPTIESIEYRNLAPLYAEEEMVICGARTGEEKWEVWIEGPTGGYAVKGTVTVRDYDAADPAHEYRNIKEDEGVEEGLGELEKGDVAGQMEKGPAAM
ncbi:hypothetical protein MMC25_001247 [Agyrium rufum]|nr:hypothetical protein [Agyrium rufum]